MKRTVALQFQPHKCEVECPNARWSRAYQRTGLGSYELSQMRGGKALAQWIMTVADRVWEQEFPAKQIQLDLSVANLR